MKRYFNLLTLGIQDPRVLKQLLLLLIYLVIGTITGVIINIIKDVPTLTAIWSGVETLLVLGLGFCTMAILILAPLIEYKKQKKYEKGD